MAYGVAFRQLSLKKVKLLKVIAIKHLNFNDSLLQSMKYLHRISPYMTDFYFKILVCEIM